jgi:hypothetical protein
MLIPSVEQNQRILRENWKKSKCRLHAMLPNTCHNSSYWRGGFASESRAIQINPLTTGQFINSMKTTIRFSLISSYSLDETIQVNVKNGEINILLFQPLFFMIQHCDSFYFICAVCGFILHVGAKTIFVRNNAFSRTNTCMGLWTYIQICLHIP